MIATVFILFLGLEIKHYVADYFLQPGWILAGKGDLRHPGGYVHAGIHAGLSGLVLLAAATPLPVLVGLVLAEWVVHYGLDYAKIHYSKGVHVDGNPRRFWVLHGVDQVAHQLTYAAIIYAVLAAKGFA
ncbi:Protein of unknown function [Devosia enhydra]|uniref:DUF3307 domain-containing protein n=1 Tax=Devosia enhydra TaxID=665118 RepID=A0A1K2HYN8_9HYPH|nr:DUF3307 domain-containing protein [Devosia enhydra]SFZ85147.1 Protein of unknown function [Devosia enhydra]